MKEDGLYNLEGRRSNLNDGNWNDNSSDNSSSPNTNNSQDGYRYHHNIDSLKSVQDEQLKTMEQKMDSVKSANKKELERVKDSLQKEKDEINQKLEKLNKRTASYQNNFSPDNETFFTFTMHI